MTMTSSADSLFAMDAQHHSNAKWRFTSLLLLGFCLILLSGCGDQDEIEKYEVRPVRTVTIEKRVAGEPITLTGRIEAEDEVSLAFRISGRLLENHGRLGDRVETGQVIARLESQNELNTSADGAGQSCRRTRAVDAGAQSLRSSGYAAPRWLDDARQTTIRRGRPCRRRRRRSTPPKRSSRRRMISSVLPSSRRMRLAL